MNIKELWDKAAEATEDDSWDAQVAFMQRFAELVENAARKDEREECIRECYEVAEFQGDANECAAAIRARGTE